MTVVVAVEEPALLVSVQRVVGGVQVERDLSWRPVMGIEEQINEQRRDGIRIVADPVIARRLGTAQFQSVERALARQRRAISAACRELASQHRHHRVVAQMIVVDQTLIAERDADPRPANRLVRRAA